MARPVTLFTGQWADMLLEELAPLAAEIGYDGLLSVEWEDAGMDRVHGARESAAFLKGVDFEPSPSAFDAAFAKED